MASRKRTIAIALGAVALAGVAHAEDAATLSDAITGGELILEARPRLELFEQAGQNDAEAFTLRTRLGWKTASWHGLTGLVEIEDVRDLGVWPTGETAMLAVAQRSTSGFGKAALVAVGADGSTRWVRPLPGDSPGDPAAVVVQPTGALAIGSGAAGDRELAHIWLAMVDRAGAVRWERRITGGGENARAWAAVALPDGYAIGGETATTDGTRTPHVWRIGKDGEPRWDERYPGQPGAFDIINAIATTSDGGFVLAGSTTHGPGKTNVLIIGLAADGAVRWRHTMVATAGP